MQGHQLRVARAYRGWLKLQLNWTINKQVWYKQVGVIRQKFEDLRNEPQDSPKVEEFLSGIESDLKNFVHPDPYKFPYYDGGTKYERNTPPPDFVADEEKGFYKDFH